MGTDYFKELPNNWEVKKFGDVAKITCGVAATPEYVDASVGIPFFSARNVQNGRLDLSYFQYISVELHKKLTKNTKPERGDILLTRVGAGIGEAAVVNIDFEFSVYVSLTLIKCSQQIESEFIKLLLNTNYYRYLATRDQFAGGGVQNLNVQMVKDYPIPVPPLLEQKKIAQILSTWDQAISVTEKLLGNSQQQKKALMQQLLTGKKRLLDENGVRFSNDWNKLEIGELLAESRIPSENNDPSKRLTVRLNLKGIQPRACRGTEAVDSTAHFIRSAGQFIYGKQNIHKGAFGIIPYDLNGYETSQDLPAFDFTKKCDPSWFLHYVSQESFYTSLEDKMSGTGSKRLNPKTLFKMKIACPNREEQQKIAAFLSVADQKILVIQKKLDCLKQEKKALMQQLLTGKKRVKVAA